MPNLLEVQGAPSSPALARIEEVRRLTGAADQEADLEAIINAASVIAMGQCGYEATADAPFPLVRQSLTETFTCVGDSFLHLARRYLVQVDEVRCDGVALDAADIYHHKGRGLVWQEGEAPFSGSVAVDYVAGFDNSANGWNVPEDLEVAVCFIAKQMLAARPQSSVMPELQAHSLPGAGSMTFQASSLMRLGDDGLPVASRAILARYRAMARP